MMSEFTRQSIAIPAANYFSQNHTNALNSPRRSIGHHDRSAMSGTFNNRSKTLGRLNVLKATQDLVNNGQFEDNF